MSWLSQVLKRAVGAPEIDLIKLAESNPLAAALIKPLEWEAMKRGVDALDDATFEALRAAVVKRAFRK
jgi:hypothetical protein